MNEAALIAQLRMGNQLAFKQFFNKYYQPICTYLLNFTGDMDTAQDIGQRVFVDFWHKRETISIHTSLKAYLYRMAYNQFLMDQRKAQKEQSLLERLKYEALQPGTMHSEEEIEERNRQIRKEVDQLPKRCREILLLKVQGLTYKEIAAELELSIKTVESQMRIAFTRLRENMRDGLILFLVFK